MSSMDQLIHRKSFVIAVVTKILRAALIVVFFESVFLQVKTVGAWDERSMLVLIACFMTIESFIVVTFHRNLSYYVPDYLRKGTFDYYLVRPLRLLPQVAFRVVDLMDLISFIPVAGLWWYILSQGILHPGFLEVSLFAVSMITCLVFLFSVSTIIASVSFWSIIPSGVGRMFEAFYRTARYPTDALQAPQEFLFTFLLPFALAGALPARALLGRLPAMTLVWSVLAVVVAAIISQMLWKAGLKRYSSASS